MRYRGTVGVCNFNPHPREGGDIWVKKLTRTAIHFNPHPREGGDGFFAILFLLFRVISIHTPAKGVTLTASGRVPVITDFNPHPREGGDFDNIIPVVTDSVFQSTPPRRG